MTGLRGRTRLRDRNHTVKERYVEHCLLVAEVMLAFERSALRRKKVQVIHQRDILAHAPERTRRAERPFQWQVDTVWQGTRVTVPAVPDRIFGLHFLDEPQERSRMWFFLEADRGPETLVPRNPKQVRKPTLFHKFLAYQATHDQKLHTARFGSPQFPFRGFRVLTVTDRGEGRVAGMQEAAALASGDATPGRFLFTNLGALVAHPDVLTMPWSNARGGSTVIGV